MKRKKRQESYQHVASKKYQSNMQAPASNESNEVQTLSTICIELYYQCFEQV